MKSATADFGAASVKQTKPLALSWGQACLMEFPPRENVLNEIERGEVVNCSAITERGKSTLWRNISLSLACGREFAPVVRQGQLRRVLYLDFETRWPRLYPDITKMLGQLTQAERAMISENFHVIADCRIDNWPLSLSLTLHWNALEREVQRIRPDVVIIDTLSVAFNIESENDNAEATRIMKKLTALAEKWSCVVVFLHHIGKLKQEEGGAAHSVYRSRGGSAYAGCAHAVFNLLPDQTSKDRFTLECPKLKGEKFPNTVFDIDKETRWCVSAGTPTPEPSPITIQDQLLGIFNGQPLRTGEIKKRLSDLSDRTIETGLKQAVASGELEKISHGTYQKPETAKPQSLIRDCGFAVSANRYENQQDTEDSEDWPKNGFAVSDRGELLEPGDSEDSILDAIDR